MRNAVRAVVASILLLCIMTGIAGAAAGTSLVLGWLETRPQATDALAWVLGVAAVAAALYAVVLLWQWLYRRLDRDQ